MNRNYASVLRDGEKRGKKKIKGRRERKGESEGLPIFFDFRSLNGAPTSGAKNFENLNHSILISRRAINFFAHLHSCL